MQVQTFLFASITRLTYFIDVSIPQKQPGHCIDERANDSIDTSPISLSPPSEQNRPLFIFMVHLNFHFCSYSVHLTSLYL